MTGILFILIAWIAPILVAGHIAQTRNRSQGKGQFVGAVLGWLGVIGLWLALRRKNAEGYLM
jgi:hypothetical protein